MRVLSEILYVDVTLVLFIKSFFIALARESIFYGFHHYFKTKVTSHVDQFAVLISLEFVADGSAL